MKKLLINKKESLRVFFLQLLTKQSLLLKEEKEVIATLLSLLAMTERVFVEN